MCRKKSLFSFAGGRSDPVSSQRDLSLQEQWCGTLLCVCIRSGAGTLLGDSTDHNITGKWELLQDLTQPVVLGGKEKPTSHLQLALGKEGEPSQQRGTPKTSVTGDIRGLWC